MEKLPEYTWPDLSLVQRQYVVVDDAGRYGIAYADARSLEPVVRDDGVILSNSVIWARPIDMTVQVSPAQVPGAEALATIPNAVVITTTAWHLQPDGSYRGAWCDSSDETNQRALTIVQDLGWIMPDKWADIALAGSDKSGHWNYGATLGRVGGKTPVPGKTPEEMTVEEAAEYAKEVGEIVTVRSIRYAAAHGFIPGARKIGRDWLIDYDGFNYYLDHRPRPGRKSYSSQRDRSIL